jgi:hypothetical protein
VGHLLSDYGQAVRQDLPTNAAGLFYHQMLTMNSGAGCWHYSPTIWSKPKVAEV